MNLRRHPAPAPSGVRRVATAVFAMTCVLATGCAGRADHVLTFAPGEVSASGRSLRVDVVEARYAEEALSLQCALHNDGDDLVTVRRDAVLLEDGELELPPSNAIVGDGIIAVPAGNTVVVGFTFPARAREPRSRTLGFWDIERSGRPLRPIRVDVPGVRTLPG